MLFTNHLNTFAHLFFPHNCEGCGSDIINDNHFLCSRCIHRLPETGFFSKPGNPIEKMFYGRAAVTHAGAAFYFTKHALLQHILMQLKYKSNRDAGYFLGRLMGERLRMSGRFDEVSLVVPLPLNPKKEFTRGYNQATLLCEGISEVWKRPVVTDAITRVRYTETQTKQNRVSRWQNMEGVFEVTDAIALQNRHILLVDDVITTGATLEACAAVILETAGATLSIASAAYTV